MEDVKFKIEGEEVSLIDLANMEVDEISEVRTTIFPAGMFQWRCIETSIETVTYEKDGEETTSPVVKFTLECRGVFSVVESDIDAESLIGRKHTETFFVRTKKQAETIEDIGRIKAFVKDIGVNEASIPKNAQGKTSFEATVKAAEGVEFKAIMLNRKDRNDKSRVFANLDRNKIKPLDAAD